MAKTALITGGTGGLGAAVTERLLAVGWRVVVPWVQEREQAALGPMIAGDGGAIVCVGTRAALEPFAGGRA